MMKCPLPDTRTLFVTACLAMAPLSVPAQETMPPAVSAPNAPAAQVAAPIQPASPETAVQPQPSAPAPTEAAPTTSAPAVATTGNASPSPLADPAPPATTPSTPTTEPAPRFETGIEVIDRYLPTAPTGDGHDLSPWGMFLAADWVVKAVMIGLALASVVTWTVFVVKIMEVAGASVRARASLRRLQAARTLPEAMTASQGKNDAATRMLRAASAEYERSSAALDGAGNAGVKERVASHLNRIEAQAGRRLARGTGLLATIGSTAPFVGLFGTVWGIMNSFIGISESQTTNLAVVAPGIAEALLATGIGLVAAIPAVVIYNVFARAITGYRMALADGGAAIERLVSRDLDFRKQEAA